MSATPFLFDVIHSQISALEHIPTNEHLDELKEEEIDNGGDILNLFPKEALTVEKNDTVTFNKVPLLPSGGSKRKYRNSSPQGVESNEDGRKMFIKSGETVRPSSKRVQLQSLTAAKHGHSVCPSMPATTGVLHANL